VTMVRVALARRSPFLLRDNRNAKRGGQNPLWSRASGARPRNWTQVREAGSDGCLEVSAVLVADKRADQERNWVAAEAISSQIPRAPSPPI